MVHENDLVTFQRKSAATEANIGLGVCMHVHMSLKVMVASKFFSYKKEISPLLRLSLFNFKKY